MRSPLMRFTVRRLMIVIAFVGVLFGLGLEATRLARISATRRKAAESYTAYEALSRKFSAMQSQRISAAIDPRNTTPPANDLLTDRDAKRGEQLAKAHAEDLAKAAAMSAGMVTRYQRNAAYWSMMNKKYADAARYPWREMEPDPPPPE